MEKSQRRQTTSCSCSSGKKIIESLYVYPFHFNGFLSTEKKTQKFIRLNAGGVAPVSMQLFGPETSLPQLSGLVVWMAHDACRFLDVFAARARRNVDIF